MYFYSRHDNFIYNAALYSKSIILVYGFEYGLEFTFLTLYNTTFPFIIWTMIIDYKLKKMCQQYFLQLTQTILWKI